jgi:hypothetical protein
MVDGIKAALQAVRLRGLFARAILLPSRTDGCTFCAIGLVTLTARFFTTMKTIAIASDSRCSDRFRCSMFNVKGDDDGKH